MPNSCQWMLLLAAPPALGGSEQSICCSQFALRPAPGGQKGKGRGKMSCSHGPNSTEELQSSPWALGREAVVGQVAPQDEPAWDHQFNRFVVPCRSNPQRHWHRTARGISLGKLFYLQGVQWTSHGLYEFYKSCRVLALKQKFTVGALSKYSRRMQQQELQRPSLSPGHSHRVGARLFLSLCLDTIWITTFG